MVSKSSCDFHLRPPSKGKLSGSHKLKFYQAMNMFAGFKSIKQLAKILRRRISWEHNRQDGRKSLLATHHSFLNMIGMIL
jgi:hypothetical protein